MRAFRDRLFVLWDDLRDCCDPVYGVGGGALLAWVLLLSLSPVFDVTEVLALGSWRPVALVFVLAWLIALPLPGRTPRTSGWAISLLVVYGLAAAFGVLLFAFSAKTGAALITALLGLAVMAAGLVALVMTWGRLCARMRRRERVGVTAIAAITGSLLYLLIALLPYPVGLIAGALLPIAAAGVFQYALLTPLADDERRDDASISESVPSRGRLVYERSFAITIMVFGGLVPLVIHSLVSAGWSGRPFAGALMVFVFLVVEIALTIYMVKVSHREDPNVAFRPTALLAAAGFFLLPMLPESLAPLCMALSFSGIGAFLVYYWIVMGNISQRFRWSPSAVYAQGLILLVLGMGLGELVAALVSAVSAGFARTAYTAVVALFALSAMLWMKVEGSVFASEPVDQAEAVTPDDEAGALGPDRLMVTDSAVYALEARYGISPREAEIMRLLVRGRNVPHICDELFIAKSTVQTHVKHIYAKLGVSNRQELIDLVERTIGERQAERG